MSARVRLFPETDRVAAPLLGLVIAGVLALSSPFAQAQDGAEAGRTVLVLDASGSMWQRIEGGHKITIARQVVGDLLDTLPPQRDLGLWAYGHSRKGDCGDIEELVPAGRDNRAAIRQAVESLNPKGKTPLSDAVRRAAEALRYEENAATVVLISDGRETCDRDPCAVADALEAAGIDFTTHVIGFDVDAPEDQAQLRCLAENTGGTFRTASDAAGLKDALVEVTAAAPAPAPEPEPAPAPAAPTVTVTAPASAPAGSLVTVQWSPLGHHRDKVTIVPMDARDDRDGRYKRAGNEGSATLQAPGEPGLYEVRYLVEADGTVAGRAAIELTDTAVSVSAPGSAPAGSRVDVTWSQTVHPRDFLTIVPKGAPDDARTQYKRTGSAYAATLQAPGEAGLYEVRYVLEEGRRVLGRAPLELTANTVTLNAPTSAPAGSGVDVTWSPTVHPRDFVTIVPKGAPDDARGDYKRTGNANAATLRAPGETGLYEVRYVLEEGRRVLARAPLELTGSQVTLSAPASAPAGSRVEVQWSPTVHPRDYLTIVPNGSPDDARGDYTRTGNADAGTLQTPAEAGLYEVRYVLEEGRRVLARAPLELTAAQVSLSAPTSAPAGARVDVEWSPTVHPRDYVTIVPKGATDDETGDYKRTGNGNATTLRAPDAPGLYEVRYILQEGRRVLARQPLELTALSATLSAPAEVVAGAPFDVSWQGPQRRKDMVELVPANAGPDAQPLAQVRADRETRTRMTAPAEGGAYQVRYRLGETGAILGKTVIAVTAVQASLNAPDSVAPGATVQVRWTGPGGDQDRIALAGSDQGPFQWLAAAGVRTDEGDGVMLTAPNAPGPYELRYLDVANGVVLARRPITVR